jgi:hypothetical protein
LEKQKAIGLNQQCLTIGISFIQAFLSRNQTEIGRLNQTLYLQCSPNIPTTLLQQEPTTASPDYVQEPSAVGLDTLFSSLSRIIFTY